MTACIALSTNSAIAVKNSQCMLSEGEEVPEATSYSAVPAFSKMFLLGVMSTRNVCVDFSDPPVVHFH